MQMKLYIILTLLFLSSKSLAQVENVYGTSEKVANRFFSNYKNAVNSALTKYKNRVLKRKLEHIRSRNQPSSLKIKNIQMLQAFFKLDSYDVLAGQSFVETQNHAYEFVKEEGKLYFHENLDEERPLTMREAEVQLKQVTKQHLEKIRALGINPRELFFKQTNFMMLQSSTRPDNNGRSRNKKPVVDGIMTYALRGIEGIMLDGSYLKILSKSEGRIETVKLRWPDFKFHPAIEAFSLKDKEALVSEILREIKRTSRSQTKIMVKMAVILRDVKYRKRRYFIPSLKVGIYTINGDAGNLFYVNLLKQKIPYSSERQNDSNSGGDRV
jgi:hypothetical protein